MANKITAEQVREWANECYVGSQTGERYHALASQLDADAQRIAELERKSAVDDLAFSAANSGRVDAEMRAERAEQQIASLRERDAEIAADHWKTHDAEDEGGLPCCGDDIAAEIRESK